MCLRRLCQQKRSSRELEILLKDRFRRPSSPTPYYQNIIFEYLDGIELSNKKAPILRDFYCGYQLINYLHQLICVAIFNRITFSDPVSTLICFLRFNKFFTNYTRKLTLDFRSNFIYFYRNI